MPTECSADRIEFTPVAAAGAARIRSHAKPRRAQPCYRKWAAAGQINCLSSQSSVEIRFRRTEVRSVEITAIMSESSSMPTLKLHYDGWIALPSELRQALGLSSGDRLAAALVDGALVLRPATKKARSAVVKKVGVAIPTEPEQGRLRLVEEPSASEEAHRPTRKTGNHVAVPKRRGRPPKAAAAIARPAVPANPIVGIGPAKLVKKAEPAPMMAPHEAPPAPTARIRPERIAQTVERRPFRNVEVRPLGPGRGHNRTRRAPSESVV